MTYSQPQPPVPPRQPAGMGMVAPQSIKNAVMAMYTGAGLTLLGIITGLATKNTVLDDYRRKLVEDGDSAKEIDDAMSLARGGFNFSVIALGIIGALLWIWMAMANGKGKGWARILATVFFAISTINVIYNFFTSPRPHWTSLIVGLLTWLAGLAAIYFLYRRESSDYINRATT